MPQQVVGVVGPNRGGAVAAAMGKVGNGFSVRVSVDGGGRLPRWGGPRFGYDRPIEFGLLSEAPIERWWDGIGAGRE